jgi:hypothetical protein
MLIFFYNLVIESPQECFFNIRVHKKWNIKRIEKEGFVKKISNEIQKNLYEAYRYYLNKETAISFKTLEYYDAIPYTIIQEDNVDISIHVGEVIDIEDDGTGNWEYALIRGIFTHQANDYKKYAFFILDWYYNTGRIDDLTGLGSGLQESKDNLWPHIHSLFLFILLIEIRMYILYITVKQIVQMSIRQIIWNICTMSFSIWLYNVTY